MPKYLALALSVLCALSVPAQQIHFSVVDRPVIEARLGQAPFKNADREALIKKYLTESGCAPDQLSEQRISGDKLPNVICVLPGETKDQIIVGAHFDHVTEIGQGVVDNWSGASLLPSLLQALNTTPRHHTYVFIAFTAEEKGLLGSEFYVKHLSPEEKSHIAAMVNLDTLGLTPTKVWVTQADPKLVQALASVAKSLNVPLAERDADKIGSADSISFKKARIPSITIHSVTQETLRFLHSSADQIAAIKMDDYYQTYRLVAAYTAYLDIALASTAASNPVASH